jgi:hypothetical protein
VARSSPSVSFPLGGSATMNLPQLFQLGWAACLVSLCACSAPDAVHARFPAEVALVKNAGRGDSLIANLQGENGEVVPIIFDTGAPCTLVLDTSLEPKLGRRLATRTVISAGGKGRGGLYKAPVLYAGSLELCTGSTATTFDLSRFRIDHPALGLVGFDCLRHYCIQLDFAAGKIRFLDPEHPGGEELGKAFPLTRFKGCMAVRDTLVGRGGERSLVDTGCSFSGVLTPDLFRNWTNDWQNTSRVLAGDVRFPDGVFGGMSYTNLYLRGDGKSNWMGLDFLARHLVTLNFPKQTMYLRQRSTASLAEGTGFYDDFYPRDLRKR